MRTGRPAKIQVNADYFEKIETERQAYWLGFLYADGHSAQKAPWTVVLQSKDIEHVQALADELEYTGEVKIVNGSGYNDDAKHGRLVVCRSKMCKDLNKWGRNNEEMSIPDIKSILIPHFIRGYFDGDGSVYMSANSGKTKDGYKTYHYLQSSFIGEESFLIEIGKHLSSIGVTWTMKDSRTNHMKYLRIHGGHNLRRLHKYMYDDSTIALQRKAEKWQALYTAP